MSEGVDLKIAQNPPWWRLISLDSSHSVLNNPLVSFAADLAPQNLRNLHITPAVIQVPLT